MRESDVKLCDGRHWSVRRRSRRSLSPSERYSRGGRGPAWEAEIGGDRDDWFVVRSRKRKTMLPEDRGRDRSRFPDRRGSKVKARDYYRFRSEDEDRLLRPRSRVRAEQHGCVLMAAQKRLLAEWLQLSSKAMR